MRKRRNDVDDLQRFVLWLLVAVGCAIMFGLCDELGYYSTETFRGREHGCIAPSPYPEDVRP